MSDPDRSKPDQSPTEQTDDASEAAPATADETADASSWDTIVGGASQDRASEPEPSPASADPTPTEVMDPVAAAPDGQDEDATQVLDPVESVEPADVADGQGDDDQDLAPAEDTAAEPDRGWMGITAFITGALLLSPIAIILGHLGLSAAKQGRAGHRTFALAGLILGYVGLVATAVGIYLLLTQSTSPEEIDVQAQQDVTAVGAAAATHASATGMVPEVAQDDAGYTVAGESIETRLETQHALTFTGSTATDWCLEITYAGGNLTAVSYTATGGMAEGTCAAG
jgi:hypothetical protein